MGQRLAMACLVTSTVVGVVVNRGALREAWGDLAGAVERRREARRLRDAVFFGKEQAGTWQVLADAREALG